MLFRKKNKSTQSLLGIRTFTRYGIRTDKGELIYFTVRPTNLAVLSAENVEVKVRNLAHIFQSIAGIEIICTDSCERFDANRAYLQRRLEDERGKKIRRLLRYDLDFFDEIQNEASASRLFLICIRSWERHDFTKSQVNDIVKKLNEWNIEAKHLGKNGIKRMLGIYFGAGTNSDLIPDYDGDQYMEDTYEYEEE